MNVPTDDERHHLQRRPPQIAELGGGVYGGTGAPAWQTTRAIG